MLFLKLILVFCIICHFDSTTVNAWLMQKFKIDTKVKGIISKFCRDECCTEEATKDEKTIFQSVGHVVKNRFKPKECVPGVNLMESSKETSMNESKTEPTTESNTESKTELTTELKTESPIAISVESPNSLTKICKFKNRKTQEFLMSANKSNFIYSGPRRYAFTWTSKDECSDGKCVTDWQTTSFPNKTGDDVTWYKVSHAQLLEDLFADRNGYKKDSIRRHAFTWGKSDCEAQCYWDIKLVEGEKDFYTLRNDYYTGEFLFADPDDVLEDGRRNIYTKQISPEELKQAQEFHWEMKCV